MGSQITLASKPGGDLLFHCLSNSTIGAVWFHGRVRDGIGWVTDAMTTKLWGQRVEYLETVRFDHGIGHPSEYYFDGTLGVII